MFGISSHGSAQSLDGIWVGLIARQAEVLQLLAEDLTDSEIAFISARPVNHHVSAA